MGVLCISKGNDKLGSIPNVSLTPGKSCSPDVQCTGECYANNIIKRFPHVAELWEDNLNYYKESPPNFFADLFFWLVREIPTHFRFHVGGDCPDTNYLEEVYTISRSLPHIKFMMFTKRYSWIVPDNIPDNLNVLLSMWPYMPNPTTTGIARTWVRGDLRAPNDIFVCKGVCTACYQCWDKTTKDILLKGH